MNDTDRLMTMAAFSKWVNGEGMTRTDVERLINVFEKFPLTLEGIDQAGQAATQMRLRQVLQARFFGQ